MDSLRGMLRRIPAIWWASGLSLLVLLAIFRGFDLGATIPRTVDVNVGNYANARFTLPPTGLFFPDYWLGIGFGATTLHAGSLMALLPPWEFFTLSYPLYAVLAVLAMYGFLREVGLGRWVAVFGGVVYGWQGPLLTNVFSGHFLPSAQWSVVACAMWALLRAVRGGGWLAAALSGACVGMCLALQQDTGMLFSLMVGFFGLFLAGREWWQGRRAGARDAVARLACVVAVAAAVGWPVVSDVLRQNVVAAAPPGKENPGERYAWATQWSLPPGETMAYLVPGFFGWKTGDAGGPYWGEVGRTVGWEQSKQGMRNFQLDQQSLGTVAFLLCLLGGFALVRWRTLGDAVPRWTAEQRAIGLFAVAGAVACLLLGFGRHAPFYRFFYELPYMDTWRNPIKFRCPGHFFMITMVAMGLDWVRHLVGGGEALAGPRKRLRNFLLLVAAGMAAGFLLIGDLGSEGAGDFKAQGYGDAEVEVIRAVAQSSLAFALVLALALAGGVHLFGKKFVEAGAKGGEQVLDRLCLAACVLATVQMLWVVGHYVEPFRFQRYLSANAPLVRVLKPEGQPARVKVFNQDPALNDLLTTLLPYHGISAIDIPAVSRMPHDYEAFFRALGNNPLRLWKLAGVRFVLAPAQLVQQLQQGVPGFAGNIVRAFGFRASGGPEDGACLSSVAQGEPVSHVVIELKESLPRATVFGKIEVLETPDAVLAKLAATDWDPAASLLLDKGAADRVGLAGGRAFTGGGTAVVRAYGKRRIEVTTRTQDGGVLMINDRFDANWHATVNGRAAEIVAADYIMRGVVVPPGEATVEMRYAAPAGGVWLSIGVWIGVLGWWVVQRSAADSKTPFARKSGAAARRAP
ncbi:MAG TPA: hypothetical protein PLU30_16930 [Verrucomicrobiae bacterium]|nr:hypothetical protein [Verrucomicrobiae bacterium]